jgi:hypothetical protein
MTTINTTINTTADLKAAIRNGPYVWPGAYPLFFICEDGDVLSYDAVRDNLRLVMSAIRNDDDPQWRVIAVDVNWEDPTLVCGHTGERIPAAYDGE